MKLHTRDTSALILVKIGQKIWAIHRIKYGQKIEAIYMAIGSLFKPYPIS
jgi:hypothetical protein